MRSKKALLNIVCNIISQITIIIYGFIVPKIIINHFGSEVNGLISSITQFLAYITLLESGFGPVIKATLYKPLAKKNKKEITSILKTSEKIFHYISYIFLAYIAVLAFTYPIIVNTSFDFFFSFSLVLIIAISTFAEYYFGMTYRLLLQADQRGYITTIIQIFLYIISIIIIVILATNGASIQIIKLVTGILFALRPIIQNIYVKKKYKIDFSEADKNYKLKNKWDGLAQHIASTIHSNTDVTILSICSSLIEVSVYSVYNMVFQGVKNLMITASDALSPTFGNILANNEKENLIKKFNLYEAIYFTFTAIIYSCVIILVTPFISVYTANITDANYVRYAFGIILAISDTFAAIRRPYISVAFSAGHFKQTRKGSWIEAGTNLVISLILVWKLGLVGVAIGTLIATLIRTINFIYHTNKYILKRSIMISINKIILLIIEMAIIIAGVNLTVKIDATSYLQWIVWGIIIFLISSLIVIGINYFVYRTEFKDFTNSIKKIFKRNKEKI